MAGEFWTTTGAVLGLTVALAAAPGARAQEAGREGAGPQRLAQLFGRPNPPAEIEEEDSAARRSEQALAAATVRIDRLEREQRNLTGQIEQLQFQIRKLEERAGAPAAAPLAPAPLVSPAIPSAPAIPPDAARRQKRGDAFDPAAHPDAPGAPKELGASGPSAPLQSGERTAAAPAGPLGGPTQLGGATPPAAPEGGAPAGPAGPKEELDAATALVRGGQYEAAEKALNAFLAKKPVARYGAEATFQLGESYFQRNRQREAAEQFLKITTNYPNASRAPEALLRLGVLLNAMEAREQACVSFAEIGRKYPNASANVRAAATRESKKIGC